VISVYVIRDQGMPPAVGISDGLSDIVVTKSDINRLIEMLEMFGGEVNDRDIIR
jgi:hypothetical protein